MFFCLIMRDTFGGTEWPYVRQKHYRRKARQLWLGLDLAPAGQNRSEQLGGVTTQLKGVEDEEVDDL